MPNSNFGNIAIGPKGQVMVSFQDSSSGAGPDQIMVSLDPDGIGGAGFGNPTVASATNVGGFTPIPASPVRTIDTDGRLIYDLSNGPHAGRVYLDHVDAPSVGSPNTKMFVKFSDDNGKTWEWNYTNTSTRVN